MLTRRYPAWVLCENAACPALDDRECETCRGNRTVAVQIPETCVRTRDASGEWVDCGGTFVHTTDRIPEGMWARECDRCGRKCAGRVVKPCETCDGDGTVPGEQRRWIVTIANEAIGAVIAAGDEECPICGEPPTVDGRVDPDDFHDD